MSGSPVTEPVHLLEKKLKSALSDFRGACDGITALQVHELLEGIRMKADFLETLFTELEQDAVVVTGQYKGEWRWQSSWFSKLWKETVSTNDITGYTGISLVRKQVYNSETGKPTVYVRTTTPAFPVLVTVRAGGRVYYHIDALYIILELPEKTDSVSLTVTSLPFASVDEVEGRLQHVLVRIEQLNAMKYEDKMLDMKVQVINQMGQLHLKDQAIEQLEDELRKANEKAEKLQKVLDAIESADGHEDIQSAVRDTLVSESSVALDKILGNEEAKSQLVDNVILPLINPGLFSCSGDALLQTSKGFLLYGPPGNGKTLLAKALANEHDITFFQVRASDIISKWLGDSERTIRSLFAVARARQPSIIFIDEVDSLMCRRSNNEHESYRKIKTELLTAFGSDDDDRHNVIVIAATNRPQDIDDAFMRRFPTRIFVDLPNAAARDYALKKKFERAPEGHSISDAEFGKLAQETEGYSFADITSLCREAAKIPLQSYSLEQKKKLRAKDIRPITFNDMVTAMGRVPPSTNHQALAELLMWIDLQRA